METTQSVKETAVEGFTLPTWLATALKIYMIAALPLVLVLLNARLLMGNAFLNWEYNRPGFLPDPYGFTTEDRLTYAPLALAYLFNAEDIDFLGDQTFPDGSPLYNDRELSHMHDVKDVTRMLTTIGTIVVALFVLSGVALALRPATHFKLQSGLLQGSIFTLGLLIALIGSVAISFNTFFVQFHAIFFEGDSWLFLNSDTLIRLFPEQFWIDAFVLLFGGAVVEVLIIGSAAWWWGKHISG
jgi:integral membrane protein (TIGR01906 family)